MLNNINVGSVPSNIWNTILCCIYLFDYLYRDKRIAHMPLKQYDFLLQYIYRTTFSMLIISDGHHYLSWWVMASDGGTGAQWSGADQCLRCLRSQVVALISGRSSGHDIVTRALLSLSPMSPVLWPQAAKNMLNSSFHKTPPNNKESSYSDFQVRDTWQITSYNLCL